MEREDLIKILSNEDIDLNEKKSELKKYYTECLNKFGDGEIKVTDMPNNQFSLDISAGAQNLFFSCFQLMDLKSINNTVDDHENRISFESMDIYNFYCFGNINPREEFYNAAYDLELIETDR